MWSVNSFYVYWRCRNWGKSLVVSNLHPPDYVVSYHLHIWLKQSKNKIQNSKNQFKIPFLQPQTCGLVQSSWSAVGYKYLNLAGSWNFWQSLGSDHIFSPLKLAIYLKQTSPQIEVVECFQGVHDKGLSNYRWWYCQLEGQKIEATRTSKRNLFLKSYCIAESKLICQCWL